MSAWILHKEEKMNMIIPITLIFKQLSKIFIKPNYESFNGYSLFIIDMHDYAKRNDIFLGVDSK